MEKSASHDEKNESCRLPASLMLRTLKNTKSKLKYMKLSEKRKKKVTINHWLKCAHSLSLLKIRYKHARIKD